MFETVSVIGLGYIGLPTAVIMASRGIKIIGVDLNENVVQAVNKGQMHIVEPGLDRLLLEVVEAGKLCAVASSPPPPAQSGISFVLTAGSFTC